MSYAILCDSTADMLPEELEEQGIAMIPLTVTMDGEELVDQVDITSEDFYERMQAANDRPRTSQPTPLNFMQKYQELFDAGFEQIISIHIAGPLSGTVESARLAASEFDAPIAVVDSCGAICKTALLAIPAAHLRKQGASFDQAVASLEAMKPQMGFMLACDTLDALVAGGRLSAKDAQEAGALNIKPIMSFEETGVLKPVGKARGMKGVLKNYVAEIERRTEEQGPQAVRFCHTGNMPAIEELKGMLSKSGVEYVDAGCVPAGITIATHTGMGAVGFSCMPAQ